MKEKEVNTELRVSAVRNGLCAAWQQDWASDWDLDTMSKKFYKGLDFYLKTRFISKESFLKCFDKQYLRQKGVLVDDKYSLLNPEHSILIGNSVSTIRCNSRSISSLYMVDKSEADIIAKGNAYVLVHVLDVAKVNVKIYDNAEVTVIIHSNSCQVKTDDNVRIRYELDFLHKK